ncbi:hypothetical protein CLIB1423_02S07734 [[Candida] railenensis]|uniref:Uncharacterized protein n=1 Tax=[Candida] railenensis TaxID=45579 RepID=A0A9P0QLL9_9ASCO|nr:hypothetical protein CLIB1423_02S07734 [[Candida] railenensis]
MVRAPIARRVILRPLSTYTPAFAVYKDKGITIEAPVYNEKSGKLVDSLKYANDIEKTRKQIKAIPNSKKAPILLSKIQPYPELLFFLARFHKDLKKIGITRETTHNEKLGKVWKYRIQYILSLQRLHTNFFEHCRLLELTQQTHKLGFSPTNIGILDPCNFTQESIEKLESGEFDGVKFNHVVMHGADFK